MKARAAFAYYDEPYMEIPAAASYIILQSTEPSLPVGGNVGGDQLLAAGVPLPLTPTYSTWIAQGRKVYRGEQRKCSCGEPSPDRLVLHRINRPCTLRPAVPR